MRNVTCRHERSAKSYFPRFSRKTSLLVFVLACKLEGRIRRARRIRLPSAFKETITNKTSAQKNKFRKKKNACEVKARIRRAWIVRLSRAFKGKITNNIGALQKGKICLFGCHKRASCANHMSAEVTQARDSEMCEFE